MEEYVIIGIIGAFVAADTTVAGQFMISQPIVSATVAGLLLGHPETGIFIGCIMQLLWLKLVPAGGSLYLNGNLGSLTAISTYGIVVHDSGIPEKTLVFIVMIYGIASSYIYGYFTLIHRKINHMLLPNLLYSVKNGRIARFQIMYMSGVLYTAVGGALVTILFAAAGNALFRIVPAEIYECINPYAAYGIYALYGIGIGTVFSMVWDRRGWYYPLIGAGAGLILLTST